MSFDQALTDFNQVCDNHVDFLRVLPEQLAQRDYIPIQRIRLSDEDAIEAVLYHHPGHSHCFSYVVDGEGTIWNAALILPEGAEERAATLAYVQAQPACREVTDDTRPFAAWLPDRLWYRAAAGRYWTSKQTGQTGRS